MLFSTDVAGALVAVTELVNTTRARDGVDRLASVADLTEFRVRHGYTGRHDRDDAELDAVRALRERVAPLWTVDRDSAVGLVNAMLAEGEARPQLVRHDAWDWHLHATPPDAPFDVQVMVETAMAFAEVVRSDEYARVRSCANEECDAVLIDLSRNSSRLFCDVNNCANRRHVEAYRARRAARER